MKIKVITCTALERSGRFLVLKRAEDQTMPGLWEFPGGKVNPKEKLEASAMRELFEESGLRTNKLRYAGYSERIYEDDSKGVGTHTLVHHFYTDKSRGDVRLSEEHTAFKWLTKDKILGMRVGKEIGTDTVRFFGLQR